MRQESVRLAMVSPLQQGGGAEFQMNVLADALAGTGHYRIFYLARETVAPLPGVLSPYAPVSIRPDTPLSRLGYLPDGPALVRRLNEVRPDVIYQRVGCGYTGICAWYAERNRVPLVWHVAHDSDVTRGETLAGRNPVRGLLEKRAVEFGLRRADAIIVQTSRQAHLLEQHYRRSATAVVPNFHPPVTAPIRKESRPLVLWVANLKPVKRPDAFIRLAAALADLPDVRFVMVGANQFGGADASTGRRLLETVSTLPNLEYVGEQSQEAVNEWMGKAAIFVNTSTAEGFPNTFVQAWLREAVVCSLEVDPDGVLSGKGLGFVGGTEANLQQVVRRLLADPGLRRHTASMAMGFAKANHGILNVSRVDRILRDVVSMRPVQRREASPG